MNGWKLIQNGEPLDGRPPCELYHYETDPLDQRNVAAEYPGVVAQLADEVALRRQRAVESAIPFDDQLTLESLSEAEYRRLRALGYLR